MKAVLFRRHGGPDVLEYVDAHDPICEPDEIVVRVRACSVNHLDIWLREGIPSYHMRLPRIPGCDVAGVVEKVGSGAGGLKAGDAVVLSPGLKCGTCGFCRRGEDNLCASYGIRGAKIDGGYAQLARAKASEAMPLPSGLSFEEAAAFPLVFLTAWHMLVARAGISAGESLLVHAAGSGVGHAAVQIARHMKATVFATVGSEAKISKARSLGADHVINYRKEDFEERIRALTDGRGVDVVFEHIGPDTWRKSLKILAKGGRLVMCGATSGPSVALDLRYVFSRQLAILGSMMGTGRELHEILQLVGEGKLKPVVDTVFSLREARAAQERMGNRDVFGKLVLRP